jgi:hypothetical protein
MKKFPDVLRVVKEMQEEAAALRKELAGTDKKRVRLAWLESQLNKAGAFLRGDTLLDKPKSRHGFVGGKRARPIKEGSSVWWTAKILYIVGQPMHIDKILERASKESGRKFEKTTVVSNLSRYVKFEDTFNRPGRNVFGLIDFSKNPDPIEELQFEKNSQEHQK